MRERVPLPPDLDAALPGIITSIGAVVMAIGILELALALEMWGVQLTEDSLWPPELADEVAEATFEQKAFMSFLSGGTLTLGVLASILGIFNLPKKDKRD